MWQSLLSAFFALTVVVFVSFPSDAIGDAQSVRGSLERANATVGIAAPNRASSQSPAAPAPAPSPPASGVTEHEETRDTIEGPAAARRLQISNLQSVVALVKQQLAQRKAQSAAGVSGRQALPGAQMQQAADLRRQDSDLHSELHDLVAQLEKQLQLEVQSPPGSNVAEEHERQAAHNALKHVITDLRGEDSELQALMGHKEKLTQRDAKTSLGSDPTGQGARGTNTPASDLRKPDPTDLQQHSNSRQPDDARGTVDHPAADLRSQIADLQQQVDVLQGQLPNLRQELVQNTAELTQRARELNEARGEADRLSQSIDTLRKQRQAEEALLVLRKLQEQLTAAVPTRSAAPSVPAPRPAQPMPVRQPTKPSSTPLPEQSAATPQLLPAPSAAQQLQDARQRLSAGQPDEARRILAMVQTQMVFQPVTPDQPATQSGNSSATDVGEAIRWLNMGASGRAMESVTRAISNLNAGGGVVRAWSGYPPGTP
jgi:hypothetical protein